MKPSLFKLVLRWCAFQTHLTGLKRPGLLPLLFEFRRLNAMPKVIDSELKARAVSLVNEHLYEYRN